MLDALVAGQRDPVVLADLAKKRLRLKVPELRRALVGRFGEHPGRLHRDVHDTLGGLPVEESRVSAREPEEQ